MLLTVHGGAPLQGEVLVPADKSMVHRALMFAGLCEGTTHIRALAPGADNLSTAQVLRALGVQVTQTTTGFDVVSPGLARWRTPTAPLDCGNSGTTMRLMAGILAGAGLAAELTGDASLTGRPMGRVCGPLRELGGRIAGRLEGGKELPPLRVEGAGVHGGEVRSPVASAQVKSALLLAGVASGRAVTVLEPAPTRDHTERMLGAMGAVLHSEGPRVGVGADTRLRAVDREVPGDISSAAFWLAAGLLVPGSEITLPGVGVNATRTGLLEVLEEMGARVRVEGWREGGGEPIAQLVVSAGPLVSRQAGDQPLRVGGDLIPRMIDELVVLSAIASQAEGRTEVRDAEELRVKESDRIAQTARLLAAFGVSAETWPDGLAIEGPAPLRPADIEVGMDHRIALTAAVLAVAAPGTSVLRGFEIAEVSYPGFADVLARLGARLA